jgi:Zn finger protein HypA/HybF involved in hydrogenase expression
MTLKKILLENRENIENMIIESQEMTYSSSNISKIDLIPTEVGKYSLILNEVLFEFADSELEKEGVLKSGTFYFEFENKRVELVLRNLIVD